MIQRCLALAVCVLLAGCGAAVDKSSVKATAGAPESTQVEVVRIPYDPSQPRYVVTVAPFEMAADGSSGGSGPAAPGIRRGWGPFGYGILPSGPQAEPYSPPPAGISERAGSGITAQLISTLSNAGNIVLVEYDHYLNNQNKPSALVHKGEVGPFVIKGSITEFNEVAEAEGSSRGGSLGWAGVGLGIAGAITGNEAVGIAGTAIGAANPTYESTKMRRTGAVGMDVRILDPASGRIVGSFPAAGKFTAAAASSGISVFGIGGADTAFAASALGQAQRAATNDAVQQITSRLAGVR